jgi:hypothetical protein
VDSHWPPAGRQAAHMPPVQNFWPQHWNASVQAAPSGAQHCPFFPHVEPLQQALLPPPQSLPSAEHCWQTPPLQMLEQQSLARVQVAPSPTQVPQVLL